MSAHNNIPERLLMVALCDAIDDPEELVDIFSDYFKEIPSIDATLQYNFYVSDWYLYDVDDTLYKMLYKFSDNFKEFINIIPVCLEEIKDNICIYTYTNLYGMRVTISIDKSTLEQFLL